MYRGAKDTPQYAHFVVLAQELNGIKFMYTDAAEYITGRAELPRDRLVVHRGQEWYDAHVFQGSTYQEMRDFIILETYRGVVLETPQTDSLVRDGHIPALRVLCHEAEACIPYITMLNESNHHGHKLIKVYKILSSRMYHTPNTTEFETPNNDTYPAQIEILDSRYGHIHHHKYEGEANLESIEKFIDHYFSYRKHAHHYSEHPDDHKHALVKSITGHNYDREILQTKKTILLLVHNGLLEEQDLRSSFNAEAKWLHDHRIGKYVKFRMLNQRDNLTPIPYHSKPLLLIIKLHMQHDPISYYSQHIDDGKVTKKMMYRLLKEQASLFLGELDKHMQEIEQSEIDTDL